jgi:sugar lactone lactonase YvrE
MPEVLITDAGRDQLAYLDDYTSAAPNWLGAPGPGTREFRTPRAIARTGTGFLIADSGNHRVVSIDDASGSGWRTFGASGSGAGQFNQPAGVAVDSKSRIYIADTGNRRVVRIDGIDGSGWVSFGTGGTPTPADPAVGKFRRPTGLAVDAKDELWIADWECSRVVHIASMAGAGWSTVTVDAPVALACDDTHSAILVGAIGAKRISRHNAATGALIAATPANALTAPAAVQLHDAKIVGLDAAARRLVTINDALSQVTTQVHLADLDIRRPMGMVVW